MNIIHKLFQNYCDWISGWTPSHLGFFVQAVLLFGLPTLLCLVLFQYGSRSVFLQTLAYAISLLLAAAIPAQEFLPPQPFLRMLIFTLCFVLLLFLPGLLPQLLTPQAGRQKKLRLIFYSILVGLFLANLLLGGNS